MRLRQLQVDTLVEMRVSTQRRSGLRDVINKMMVMTMLLSGSITWHIVVLG